MNANIEIQPPNIYDDVDPNTNADVVIVPTKKLS